MYDSITAADIPAWAPLVGGYVDGIYRWTLADWARFPGSVKVRIAVNPATNDGHVLDVETGDATPAQSVGWVRMRRAGGHDPSVYMNASTWPAVRAAFQAAGMPEPHYWVAAYPGGGAVVPDGAVAHQYAGSATSGGHYDLSAVLDVWPGVDSESGAVAGVAGGTEVTLDDEVQPGLSVRQVLEFLVNDVVGGTEDNRNGVAATVHRIEGEQANLATAVAALSQEVANLSGKIDAAFVRPSASPGP